MKKLTKLRRSVKAISPVISVLLMIAIAVAAALIAYAWVTGYMDFTTTKVGKAIQIQSISTTAVYVQNIGDSKVTLNDLYINGDLDDAATAAIQGVELDPSETLGITAFTNTAAFAEEQITVKIVTTDGTRAEYTETFSDNTGGTTPTPPPTVTIVQSRASGQLSLSGGSTTYNFLSAPTAGNFLVLVAGHRQGDPWDNHAAVTVDGWNWDATEWHSDHSGDTSHRRICVVFHRIADGTADDNPTIHWNDPDSGGTNVCYMILQEFTGATSYTKVASGGDSSGNSAVTTDNIPGSELSTSSENVLAIGGMSWRGGVTGVSFSGLGGLLEVSGSPGVNDIEGASAYDYTIGAATVLQTTVSWSTNRESSGLLVLYSCSG